MEMFAQKIDRYSDKTGAHTYEYWGDDANMGLISAFASAIAKDREVEITGEDGLKALEIALIAYESAHIREMIDLLA